MQTVDIVIPIYNEEDILPLLLARLEAVWAGVPDVAWRVIFVNDGSKDRSLLLLRQAADRDARFTHIDLSRNFGHQAAISAGLAYATADAVVIMDGDLQDPPELIVEFVATWREGAEVVVAVRSSRQERGLRRVGFDLFHRFFGWISDFPIEENTGVFCLLNQQVVYEFNRLTERNRFIPGLRSWIGFDQRNVYYDREERPAGAPKQTLTRLVRYAANGVISFSFKPLRLMTSLGVLVSCVGFLLASWFVFKRLLGLETADTGFTTLVTLILFLGGVQLCGIGLLGEYLGRTYDESKLRPLYIVRRTSGLPHE